MKFEKNTQLSNYLLKENILEIFLDDYNKSIYGRGLAKKLKNSQRTISNNLLILEKKRILKSNKKGSLKEYCLKKENPLTKIAVKLSESIKSFNFISKNYNIAEISSKIKSPSLVFGSYAKGKNDKSSDIDVLVFGKADLSEFPNVHKIEITFSDLKKNKEFFNEVLKNHIILYGVDVIVDFFWRENA